MLLRQRLHWIALEYADTGLIDVAVASGVGEQRSNISFDDQQNVALLADMQTEAGWNTAVMRYDNLTSTSAQLWVEEERSLDDEIFHVGEKVAVLTASVGVYDFLA